MQPQLIKPLEKQITDAEGNERTYILSRFPALAGREIVTQYPLSALPKLGDYKANEAMMLKLLSYVAVPVAGADPIRLTTAQLVENHVPDFECLMRLEGAMLEYNCSFFKNGVASTFFARIAQTAQALISQTLTDFAERSSHPGKPRSTN